MCTKRLPSVLGRTCCPVSLLCFVMRYFQLQVTENPDSTSSNNRECIMSPSKKPGGRAVRVVYSAGELSPRQPGCFYLSVLLAQVLPSSPQGCWGTADFTASRASHLYIRRQVERTFVLCCCFLRSTLPRLPLPSHQ